MFTDWLRLAVKRRGQIDKRPLSPQHKPKTHLHPRAPVGTNMKIDLDLAALYINPRGCIYHRIQIFGR